MRVPPSSRARAPSKPWSCRRRAALGHRGASAVVMRVSEEPGWHFISHPAWESAALVRGTVEWLRAVA